MDRRVSVAVAVLVLLAVLVAGCGARKGEAGLGGDAAAAGIDEKALREGRVGSLDQAKAGVLGSDRVPSGPLFDVYYNYDSFELDGEARSTLQANANWLDDHQEVRVEIEGHCDDRGTVDYNLGLGAKRAAAAKTYLVSLGVDPGRVTTISYGEELPVCHEPVDSCWSRNRRAHFVVLGN